MTIRERIEELERETLSPYAALSADSRGREIDEDACDVRTVYQRDRDRIIHQCKAFRRLAGKTQVFISPRSDHIRTRLSHTLEVSQIARTIAKALRLNEPLTEAISLGHDVGHTPFGHAGETVVDGLCRRFGADGFQHAEHSVRVVTKLERGGRGLNLCGETLDGIGTHSKGRMDVEEVLQTRGTRTLEAVVVALADRIAYTNHDTDDCIRAGFIHADDIPDDCAAVLGDRYSARISTMNRDIIEQSEGSPEIRISPRVAAATDSLKNFLYEWVYHSPPMLEERERVRIVVESLFELHMNSNDAVETALGFVPEDERHRARLVCDYIAGMTDRYAADCYVRNFLPGAATIGE